MLLKEDACILNIEHLYRLQNRIVKDAVGPHDIRLLIVPFDLEGVFLLSELGLERHCSNHKVFKLYKLITIQKW